MLPAQNLDDTINKIQNASGLPEAISFIDQAPRNEGYTFLGEALAKLWSEHHEVRYAYCAAMVYYDLNDLVKSKALFLLCGKNGLASGYYRAAIIQEEIISSSFSPPANNIENDELSLFRASSKLGHIFGRLAYLRRKKKNLFEWVLYSLHRFLLAPVKILITGIFDPSSDKIRF